MAKPSGELWLGHDTSLQARQTTGSNAGGNAGGRGSLAGLLPNSSGLNLASIDANGQQMAINGLPPALLAAPLTVRLFVGVLAYGTYTMLVG